MGANSKESLLYIHREDTEYQCSDCTMFNPKAHSCSVHRSSQLIRKIGSCGFFYQGAPRGRGSGYLTHAQSGYDESKQGFSCKRCVHFLGVDDEEGCEIVDAESAGDDPGYIDPDACCNAWEPFE